MADIRVDPYAFEDAYCNCFAAPQVAMDKRHIFIMHEILCAWPFNHALEIGSYWGASATAFIEAINRADRPELATFCDVVPTESLMHVVGNCKDLERVRVTPEPSWRVLRSRMDFDFIFVDGSHDTDTATLEIRELLRRRPSCVMLHDSNASRAGYDNSDGAAMLAETFRRDEGYGFVEDFQKRDGERTERGLLFATTDQSLHQMAVSIFEKWRT